MREIIILSCTRCDHRWVQRGENPPMQCSGCRSTYWAKKKVRFAKPKYPGGVHPVDSAILGGDPSL